MGLNNGVFADKLEVTEQKRGGNTLTLGGNNVSFNASRSNSIYGKSTTITPLSLSCSYYIKY